MTSFIALSLASGLTVGLGKVVTTLYALELGASAFQVGIVSAMESVGMILVTVPAGFIIARYGARSIYFAASFGPLLVNLALPFSSSWAGLAIGRGLIGLCIPFRMVSMNGAFLERLKGGNDPRGGWYRGSLTAGLAVIGPAVAGILTASVGVTAGFFVVAALFGLMGVFSLSFLPQRSDEQGAASSGFFSQVTDLLRERTTRESCAVEFLSAATAALFSTFIILLAIALPPLTEQDGIHILVIQGIAAVALLFVGGTVASRLSRNALYGLGLGLAVAALIAFGFARGMAALAVGAVSLSAATALVHLVNVRMLANIAGAKSKVAGLYNLASMTGSSAGAIGGGLISKLVPLQWVFLAWLPVLLAGALFVGLRQRAALPSLAASEA
jgi:predicted MFS family arabinose efflux permease